MASNIRNTPRLSVMSSKMFGFVLRFLLIGLDLLVFGSELSLASGCTRLGLFPAYNFLRVWRRKPQVWNEMETTISVLPATSMGLEEELKSQNDATSGCAACLITQTAFVCHFVGNLESYWYPNSKHSKTANKVHWVPFWNALVEDATKRQGNNSLQMPSWIRPE